MPGHWWRALLAQAIGNYVPFFQVKIFSEDHLRRVMRDYITYYNTARPHQGLEQHIPIPRYPRWRTVLYNAGRFSGGLLHDYYREAA